MGFPLRPAAVVAQKTRAVLHHLFPSYWAPHRPRVYISGPISGYHDGNRKAFADAGADLAWSGLTPVDPHEVGACLPDIAGWSDLTPGEQWLEYMRLDVAALAASDTVLVLPGWRRSRGAKVEYRLARGLGLKVDFQRPTWLDRISDLYWNWRKR